MRYLEFTLDDRSNYDAIYGGIVSTPRAVEASELRVMSSILNKLEVIAEPRMVNNHAIFAQTKNGIVALEDAEYELLEDILMKVKWVPANARAVANMFEFFKSAPTTLDKAAHVEG